MTDLMPIQKTTKGLAELTHPAGTLDLKSRQFLILADGKRTVACIQALRPSMDVNAIFVRLASEGYVVGDQNLQVTPAPPLNAPPSPPHQEAPPLLTEESMAEAKTIMLETTRQYVGILGGDLTHKIGMANNLIQLKSCIAQWNMAIRDSRQGKAAADQYLQKVQLALGIVA